MSDDLVAFLRARLDEDEAAAKGATPGPWRGEGMSVRGAPDGSTYAPSIGDTLVIKHTWPQEAAHILRHDPARVLREVEAKRRLVNEFMELARATYPRDLYDGPDSRPTAAWGLFKACERSLVVVAAVYSDHPDYQPKWKP